MKILEQLKKRMGAGWSGRPAVRLANDKVQAALLPGGGLLAELRFNDDNDFPIDNVLWVAPWETHSPGELSDKQIVKSYGDLGTGRFLDSFTGHALCLDGFGPASERDVQAGAGLHGEASIAHWDFTSPDPSTATGSAILPLANLRVDRVFSLLPGETLLRVQESVSNLSSDARPLHWVQHATVGAPFFHEGASISTSADLGVTWPLIYDGKEWLKPDSKFSWPHAPQADGATADLSVLFGRPGNGFVAAVRQIPGREFGFVAAYEPNRPALVYVFPAETFPWVTFWEENAARADDPWNGNVQARGLEFGTTPFPLGNEAVDAAGPLLDTATSYLLPGCMTAHASWIVALVTLPHTWNELNDLVVEENSLLFSNGEDKFRMPAARIAEFLRPKGEPDGKS